MWLLLLLWLSFLEMELRPLLGLETDLDLDLTHFVLVFFTLCMGLIGSLLGSSLEAAMPALFGDVFRYGKSAVGRDKNSKVAER